MFFSSRTRFHENNNNVKISTKHSTPFRGVKEDFYTYLLKNAGLVFLRMQLHSRDARLAVDLTIALLSEQIDQFSVKKFDNRRHRAT